jgi:hypothetical protein
MATVILLDEKPEYICATIHPHDGPEGGRKLILQIGSTEIHVFPISAAKIKEVGSKLQWAAGLLRGVERPN